LTRPAHTPTLARQALALAIALAVTFAAASLGGLGSADAGGFYGELSRPPWAPPGWLFGPVWAVLYTLMALAAWLVWRTAGLPRAAPALLLYGLHLLPNALWSWFFFAWRDGLAALIDISVLWLLIAATMALFWRIHRLAAVLLAPYLCWASFAAALTLSLWLRNPQSLG
jgi:tryptophan-rich sensory protein